MTIHVKYYGKSDFSGTPKWQETVMNVRELSKLPFGKKTPTDISTGRSVLQLEKDSHTKLRFLDWEKSGHTGSAGKYAGWDENGNATLLEGGGGGGGDVDLSSMGIYLSGSQAYVGSRRAVLHSPGAGWAGAEWSVGSTTISVSSGTNTIYFSFDPEDTELAEITTTPTYPISVRLYSVYVDGEGVAQLSRVFNPGDIDIIAMWLRSSE